MALCYSHLFNPSNPLFKGGMRSTMDKAVFNNTYDAKSPLWKKGI